MTVAELLTRARSQIGRQTRYALGGGTVSGSTCQDLTKACDCSGFILWCLQWRRRYAEEAWLKHATGGWLNTDGIWYDATHGPHQFVRPLDSPQAGGLIVYPAAWMSKQPGPKVGHIGILTSPETVIHCSAGNMRRCGDAIQETALTVFQRPATLYAWPVTLTSGDESV